VDKPDKPRAAEAALSLAAEREAPARRQRAQDCWPCGPTCSEAYAGDEYVVKIRDKEIRTALTHTTLSGTKIRKVGAAGAARTTASCCKWLMLENVPGSFPYTAGAFAFKRENEDPTRMFAGEGDAFRTNRRFKLLVARACRPSGCPPPSTRVTLYGHDPDLRPGHLRQGRQLRRVASPRWTT
jgi:methylmalonyl-CoA mutase